MTIATLTTPTHHENPIERCWALFGPQNVPSNRTVAADRVHVLIGHRRGVSRDTKKRPDKACHRARLSEIEFELYWLDSWLEGTPELRVDDQRIFNEEYGLFAKSSQTRPEIDRVSAEPNPFRQLTLCLKYGFIDPASIPPGFIPEAKELTQYLGSHSPADSLKRLRAITDKILDFFSELFEMGYMPSAIEEELLLTFRELAD